jgi:hypothetical protein
MANYNFNVEDANTFKVEQYSKISTDCATQFVYKVTASESDSIEFSLEGSTSYPIMWTKQSYTVDGVEGLNWTETNTMTVSFSNDLYISFVIDNSGDPGRFNECKIIINNTTTSNSFVDAVIRENDSLACDNPEGNYTNFDALDDTPDEKTGSSLKIVRVRQDETKLEYVGPETLGPFLSASKTFTSSSTWFYNDHNLGKKPSVIIIDNSGNRMHGEVNYTDLNNLIITFVTAAAGTVYLN